MLDYHRHKLPFTFVVSNITIMKYGFPHIKFYNAMINKNMGGACLVAEAVMVVWYLDLQLYMQSVPITTEVVSSNPAQARST
jgi:hypothetical protein